MLAQNFCLAVLVKQFITKLNFTILKLLLYVIFLLALFSFEDLFFSILPDQEFLKAQILLS
jgi:hypothetical protein